MTIKVLCIIEDADRPTIATFIGMHRAGIELTVSCPESSPRHEILRQAGIPLVDLRFRRRFDSGGAARLREHLENNEYDILHVFGNKTLQNALVATRGVPIKIIAYRGIVGNVSFLDPISWLTYLNPRIDRIICVANAIRDYFLQMQPSFLRMPAERPVTIHKGHSLDWYTESPTNLQDVGIPAGAFVIGCVANYRPRKGIEILVAAMDDLPQEWNVLLMLVGNMEGAKLDRAIERSPSGNNIHRVGYRQDAPALTAACDVFVLPSIKREGLPRSVIEAMAYGVPPIVTDTGGSPELVEDGVSGLVVRANDSAAIQQAIRRLYQDPELRERMGRAARERIATTFRIEDTIEKTMALYRELVPQ